MSSKSFPTWRASPWRRAIQAACLALFLVLLFGVCWPHTARPARTWPGWRPVEFDGRTGRATLEADGPAADAPRPGMVLHLIDASAEQDRHLGAFRIVQAGAASLTVEPAEPMDAAQLERASESFGPWSLAEDPPGRWPSHHADSLRAKEILPAELFLVLDPLVSISTAIAGRAWVWSLGWAAAVLAICLVVPRGFCAYVCPLGTLIDLFDWALGKRVTRFRVQGDGWYRHLRYYVLAAVVGAALVGVLLAGFVAAIPVLTRGMVFLVAPLQTGLLRGWHQVPPFGPGQLVSLVLFGVVLGLGLLRARFWCKYVCPSGAVFSVGNLLRLKQRKVEARCIECGRCAEVCPFDAVEPDYRTRTGNCAFCRTCGGVCPVEAIHYVGRWTAVDQKAPPTPAGKPLALSPRVLRRGFLGAAAGLAGGGLAWLTRAFGAQANDASRPPPLRPPGSVPEREFLAMCIRCGECFRACPNDVLQPLGFEQGLEGLWTPQVSPDWSGCETSCNICGQVCPTGAIRALDLEEKRVARIGLAVVDRRTCLPFAGREACQLCVDECATAGYHAIEFMRVGTEMDESGKPIEESGWLAPVVLQEKCVGCGLCQTRCYGINVVQKGLLGQSAIRVEAGPGKEDRLMRGSYLALRKKEARQREQERLQRLGPSKTGEDYRDDFGK